MCICYATTSIHLFIFIKNLINFLLKFSFFFGFILPDRIICPGIISTGTDSYNATYYGHRVCLQLLTNKCDSYSASCAKKTAAFLIFRVPYAMVRSPGVSVNSSCALRFNAESFLIVFSLGHFSILPQRLIALNETPN